MLSQGMDNPMLRFGLGKGYLDAGQPGRAAQHLRRCVELDPKYSAAWKLLGKALQADGDKQGAHEAWEAASPQRTLAATSRRKGNERLSASARPPDA